jgi:hypothetical protein
MSTRLHWAWDIHDKTSWLNLWVLKLQFRHYPGLLTFLHVQNPQCLQKKNSSRKTVDSWPGHFGTNATRERSLWRVVTPSDIVLSVGGLRPSPLIILLANIGPSFWNFCITQFKKIIKTEFKNVGFNSCYVSSRNLSPVLTTNLARGKFLIHTSANHL